MIRETILLLCLIISSYSYSQTTYPRTEVIGIDTVVVISRQQAIKINLLYSQRDQYKEISDSLLTTIDSCKTAFRLYDTTISGYRKEIASYKISINDRDTVIKLQKDIITDQKKKIRKLRITNKITSIAAVVLGIVAIGALIF